VPKSLRVILAVLLLALPVAWWALRVASEEPAAPGKALAPARPVPSSPSVPRASASPQKAPPADSEEAEDTDAEEDPLEDVEEELAGPGPCIQIEVLAHGAPLQEARVDAAMVEDNFSITLSPIRVGPEGKRQGWCKPGKYMLGARAPGFASSLMELTVKAGGAPPLARFQLDAGFTLSGTVLDKDSQGPISQARVSVSRTDTYALVMKEFSATSDAHGVFHVSGLAEGAYNIQVDAPGHTSVDTEAAVPRTEPLTVELAGTARLEGQVVDGAGAPVPGAELEVNGSGDLIEEETPHLSDAQGRFSIEVGEGTWRLSAKHNGLAGQHEGAVTVARGGLVDGLIISLRPGGTVSGTVVVGSTQEPIEGAVVLLRNTQSGWDDSVDTDAAGRFRMEQLLPGEYSLTVVKDDFSQAEREELHVEASQELSVKIPLAHHCLVEGKVTDALGRPADDGLVSAIPIDSRDEPQRRTGVAADAEGHYSLGPLLPGSYRLEARLSHAGKVISREITLAEGQTLQADFVLPEAQGQLEGVVQREGGGTPAWHVEVTVTSGPQQPYVETDDTGHFNVRLLPGAYTLYASYTEMDEGGSEQHVTVEAGKLSRVTLTVPSSITETSGIVLNARGEPVPDASVSLSNDKEELSVSTSADARGRFTLRTAQDTAGAPVSLVAENGAERGKLENVRVGSRDVVVRLERAAALRGRVVAARGAPVQGFALGVYEASDAVPSFSAEDSSPFVGDTFELAEQTPGLYTLLVRASDGRSGMTHVKLVPGQTTTVEVPVGMLGRITGKILNDRVAPRYRIVRVYLDHNSPREREADVSNDGRFELVALDPGEHSLSLGLVRELPLHLSEGETIDLGEFKPDVPPTDSPPR
jgi:carboxypeptidase family protein